MKRVYSILIVLLFVLSSSAQTVFQSLEHLKQSGLHLGKNERFSLLGFHYAFDGGAFEGTIVSGQADEISSFALSNGLIAKRDLNSKSVDISSLGAQFDSTSNEALVQNWHVLKRAFELFDIIYIPDTLRVYLPRNDSIPLHATKSVLGFGDASRIVVYPKFKGFRGKRIFFKHFGGDLIIDKTIVEAYPDRWKYETYDCIFRPATDADAVQLSGPYSTSFWSRLSIGDTLCFQVDDNTPGSLVVVANIDQGAEQISFTGNFGTADDYSVAGQSYIGIPWNESANPADVDAHSLTWNTINEDELVFFESVSISDPSQITFSSSEVKGFDRAFLLVASNTKLDAFCSTIQANSIGISWTGANVNEFARVYLSNGFLVDCATLCQASINPNGIISSNARFGGGVYAHPGIVPFISNMSFDGNQSTTVRNFSSSGNDISRKGWKAYYVNCTWYDTNEEPPLITSKSFPSVIQNCHIYAKPDGGISTIYIGHSTTIRDSYIDAPVFCNLNSEPSDCDTCDWNITLDNLRMGENFRFNGTLWPDSIHNKTNIQILNSSIYPSNQNAGYTFRFTAGKIDIINLNVKNRKPIAGPYNDLIVIDSTLASGKSMDLFMDRIVYDSTLNHTFIRSHVGNLSPNYKIQLQRSDLKATNQSDGSLIIN